MNKRNVIIVIGILVLIFVTLAAVYYIPQNKRSPSKQEKMIVKIENLKTKDLTLKKPIVVNPGGLRLKTKDNLLISKWGVGLFLIDNKGQQKNIFNMTGNQEIGGVSMDAKNNFYIGVADIDYIEELDVVSKAKIIKINKNGDLLKTLIPPEEAYQILAVTGDTIITSNLHGHGLPNNKKKTLSIFFLDTNGNIKKEINVDKFISNPTIVWLDRINNFYFARHSSELLTVLKVNVNGKLLKKLTLKKNKSINENINFIGTDKFGFIYTSIDRPNYKYPTAIVRKYTIGGKLVKEIKHKAGLGDQYTVTPDGQIFLSQSNQLKSKLITKLYRID